MYAVAALVLSLRAFSASATALLALRGGDVGGIGSGMAVDRKALRRQVLRSSAFREARRIQHRSDLDRVTDFTGAAPQPVPACSSLLPKSFSALQFVEPDTESAFQDIYI